MIRTGVANVALVSLLAVSLLVWFTPAYMVNDDLALAMFASGGYTGHPSPRLVFMGIVPGSVLWLLYTVTDSVPWYPVMLITLLVLANAFILTVAWRLRHQLGVARWALGVLAMATTFPTMVLDLTFTSVAITVGVAALLGYCLTAFVHRRMAWRLVAPVTFGLVTCAALRSDALVAVLAVFAPTLALSAIRAPRRVTLAIAVGTLSIVGLSSVADNSYSSRGSWPEYNEFNAVRGTLHGARSFELLMSNRDDPATTAALAEIGWAWEDLELFGQFFFDDPVVYSSDRMKRLQEFVGEGDYRSSVREAIDTVTDGRSALLVIPILAALLSAMSLGWRGRLYIGLQSTWAASVFVFTAATQRFPDRIAVPLFLGLGAFLVLSPVLLFEPTPKVLRNHEPARQSVVAVLFLWLGLLNVTSSTAAYSASHVSHDNDVSRARYERDMFVLDAVDPAGRFVYAGAWVSIEGSDPFDPLGPYDRRQLLGMGWPTFSPLYEARRELLGIPGDLLKAFVEQDGLYLVIGFDAADVQDAYARRLGIHVDFVLMARLDDGAGVYKVTPSA